MARRSHREKRTVNAIRQLPWGELVNPYAPIEMLSADQVETIIDTALNVLATQGMRFLEPGSRKLMRQESIFALASALERLPESQREAIRMKYIEGRSVLEIAKAMEKSVTAVAGLLKRGLEGLRESMAVP